MSTMKRRSLNDEDYLDGYYHIGEDLEKYPDAWCYIVYSGRGPGKTYSALRYALRNHMPILYAKRTKKDVNFICTPSKYGMNRTPYAPLNRDFGLNIDGRLIDDGVGLFGEFDDNGELIGDACAYCFSFNGAKEIKGYDLSMVDMIVLDEFIPMLSEVVRKGTVEGELLLSMYESISRDRSMRDRKPLKLILFSNTDQLSCGITEKLEVVDHMAEMEAFGEDIRYLEDRGILIHHLSPDDYPVLNKKNYGAFKVMRGTAWEEKNMFGLFASNDFSNIRKVSIKKMKCFCKFRYQRKWNYIYRNEETGQVHVCKSGSNLKDVFTFDLEKENDQKAFWYSIVFDLRNECIDGKVSFSDYSLYDLIINYKKKYSL